MWSNSFLFIISGPSGSGKTTLIKHLLKDKELQNKLIKSVSFTTRAKRKRERNRRDYLFISQEEFKQKLKTKKILEWTKFLDYYYGTFKFHFKKLLKRGKHILLCLDERGAHKIKRLYPKRTITIYILPPKMHSLKIRLSSPDRKPDSQDLIKRLALAKKQTLLSKNYDFRIINDDFNTALKRLKKVILNHIK